MQVPKVLATCKTLPGTLTSFYIRYSQMTDNVWHFSPHSIVIKYNGSATLNVNVLLSMHIIYIPGLSHLQGICPNSTAGLKFTVPLLQSLPGKGVGVKVKLGTDKKLCCLLFSPTDSPYINHSALIEKSRCCPLFVTTSREVFDKEN